MRDIVFDFKILRDTADLLALACDTFEGKIGPAIYLPSPWPRFRFSEPNEKTFTVLRCVRIASGLRASLVLLEKGLIQETGVLIRTLQEFSHDLDFVVEGFLNKIESGPRVKERMEVYFSEDYRSVNQMLCEKRAPTTPRRKIFAAVGRLLDSLNPHRYRQNVQILEDVYSGYVHGNYPHVMELYDGATHRFAKNGIEAKIEEWLTYLATTIHPTLNQFSTIASLYNLQDLKSRLIKQRELLEIAPVYTR